MHSSKKSLKSILAMALGIPLLTFTLSSCIEEPAAPVLPSWDVDLTLPLGNREYTLLDIVEKDSQIVRVGSGNEITLRSATRISPTAVGDRVSITPRDFNGSLRVGVFSIVMAPLVNPLPLPWLPRGVPITVPDTTLVIADIHDTVSVFRSVVLEDGTIQLSFANLLPVPVDIVAPVYLLDDGGGIVATFMFYPATVPPNGVRTAEDNLANKTLGNPQAVSNIMTLSGLRLRLHPSSSPIIIPEGNLIIATVSTSGLRARRAESVYLPAQQLVDTDTVSVALGDSTHIQELHIRSGRLDISCQSRFDADIILTMRIRELMDPIGNGSYRVFEDSLALSARGSASRSIDLSGKVIRSINGGLISDLQLISTVTIPIPTPRSVTLSDTDGVALHITPSSPIVADSVVGILKPTWFDVHTVVPLDFGQFSSRFAGQLHIPSANLEIEAGSSIGFPADVHLSIGARKNGSGDSAFLHIPVSQRRVVQGTNVIRFQAAEVGQFLSQISGGLPPAVALGGRILVNPTEIYTPTLAGVGMMGRSSAIGGVVTLDVPLMLSLTNGSYADTTVIGDTTGDGVQDIGGKTRLRSMNSGRLFIDIDNGIPAQMGIHLQFLNRAGGEVLAIPRDGSSLAIAAASVNQQGNADQAAQSRLQVALNSSQIRAIEQADLLAYTISVATTPGAPTVRFLTTNRIKLRLWSTFSQRINP